jgi:hypothetical protein
MTADDADCALDGGTSGKNCNIAFFWCGMCGLRYRSRHELNDITEMIWADTFMEPRYGRLGVVMVSKSRRDGRKSWGIKSLPPDEQAAW